MIEYSFELKYSVKKIRTYGSTLKIKSDFNRELVHFVYWILEKNFYFRFQKSFLIQ
ncbi:hypothetical protein G436_2696 [Leptospira interrogans serovar Hardjo str. Norma]|uniref:Uncharacterized protein n=1 Tax=Leptospira interrogans serovar Hardjo str. Norma TaxID=1279460 RepID=A0A0M5L880_LEPIR|nr:hypothetical protein G436_2696 [Leptospira interrogans serovar Hardjo str. Norma]